MVDYERECNEIVVSHKDIGELKTGVIRETSMETEDGGKAQDDNEVDEKQVEKPIMDDVKIKTDTQSEEKHDVLMKIGDEKDKVCSIVAVCIV